MADKFTPWDELFGPSPSPANPLPPATPVVVTPVTPEPVVVPTPIPVNPAPQVPVSPTPQTGRWQMVIAAAIVGAGMLGTGWLVSKGKTNPTPPTPVVVPSGPVVDATLSTLLPDASARGMVASYFRDVSKFLETSKLQTTGQVRDAVQAGVKDLKAAIGEPNWSAVNTPISNRITLALGGAVATGPPDIPLDTPLPSGATPRQILVKEYAQIGIDARGQ